MSSTSDRGKRRGLPCWGSADSLEGTLKDILPTPEKVNDAIFYYARFEVPNPQGILRLDMTAQVHIQLAEVKNVITIPLRRPG